MIHRLTLNVALAATLGSVGVLHSAVALAQSAPAPQPTQAAPQTPPAPQAPSAAEPLPTPVAPPRVPQVTNNPPAEPALQPRLYLGLDLGGSYNRVRGINGLDIEGRVGLSTSGLIGVQLTDRIAAEATYSNYDDIDIPGVFFGSARVKQSAVGLAGVVNGQFNEVTRVYGRLGFADGRQKVDQPNVVLRNRSKTTVVYGIGTEMRLGQSLSFTLGVDFIRDFAGSGENLRDIRTGVRWRF